MTEVDLNHIYKKYDGNDRYSVNDFDLHIKDKEFIVFVGPSGCGKSTYEDTKHSSGKPSQYHDSWVRHHS